MKHFFIFFLLIILTFGKKYDNFGEPDTIRHENSKVIKQMVLPGYNPTVIVNKPPSSIEYKSNNILPYGEWNNRNEKEKNRTKFFLDKKLEKLRTSKVDFNEEKVFNQVYPEEFAKINWLPSLPKNNLFISKHKMKGFSNNTSSYNGLFHNYPQTNYFYSSYPEFEPVPLPKIEKEPVQIFRFFFS